MPGTRMVWDDKKIQYLLENWNKTSMRQMLMFLHAAEKTVTDKAKELGLPEYEPDRWTDKEEGILIALAPTTYIDIIAEKLGKPRQSVRRKAERMGIKVILVEGDWEWTPEKEKILIDHYTKISLEKISEMINISYFRIAQKIKDLQLEDNRYWTDEEVETLRKMAPLVHYREISKVLNRSVGAITAKAFDLDIKLLVERRIFTDKEKNYIAKNWTKKSTSQIARDLKSSIGLVNTTAKKLGLPHKGQKVKWTEAKLKQLKKFAKTMTIPELAEKYGTSTSAISSVLSKHKIRAVNARVTWHDEDKAKLRELAPTHTVEQIVKEMNRETHSIRSMAKRLGIPLIENKRESKSWDTEQDEQLRTLAMTQSPINIAITMERTVIAIKARAKKLGIALGIEQRGWSEEEKEQLETLAPDHTIDQIVKIMHRRTGMVKNMAKTLRIPLILPDPNAPKKPWTKEDEEKLRFLAKIHDIIDLAIILDRSDTAVEIKAGTLDITLLGESKDWTDEQKEQLKALAPDHSVDQIVKALSKDIAVVRKMAKKMGIPLLRTSPGTGKPWDDKEEERLRELAKTHTCNDIAILLERTADAIRVRANRLGIKLLSPRRAWTKDEEEELASLWGRYSIDEIAEKLGRTTSAIGNRAFVLKLGSVLSNNYEGLTIQELCDLFGISRTTISVTWVSLGMVTEKKKISDNVSFTVVRIPELLAFLEIHQDIWDSRTLPENVFGPEPLWFVEKRKNDLLKGDQTIKKLNTARQQLIAARQYYLEQVPELPDGIAIKGNEKVKKIIQ